MIKEKQGMKIFERRQGSKTLPALAQIRAFRINYRKTKTFN
jgi:hypothetical protein